MVKGKLTFRVVWAIACKQINKLLRLIRRISKFLTKAEVYNVPMRKRYTAI